MNEMELYSLWCEKAVDDPDLQTELKSIAGDSDAIKDRFYRDLEFGTGGLRGVIGAGSYRMNVYTVRRATQGLADYVNKAFTSPSVAISYDSRIKSTVFAKEAAAVLAANGIKVHIYTELMPTPMLSYAVRNLKCSAGIMITASHNPAKYNGYKVYGSDGCQLTLDAAEIVLKNIESVPMFDGAKTISYDDGVADGRINYIPQSVIDSYLDEVSKQGIHTDLVKSSGLKVVYTPLNGTGNKPVRAILKKIGVEDVTVVPEQEYPDGNFPTCPFPNPEIKEALAKGLELCNVVKPDLLLATDPDCDRVGIAVPSDNGYELFTGNEVGAMLLEYICSERTKMGTMPADPVAVKTIVTTDMAKAIAKAYGVKLIEVLTGFKYIGEQIKFFEQQNTYDYVFGLEESYGCLAGTYARDKDACVAVMMLCEVASWCKKNNMTLWDEMLAMYEKYGYYREGLETKTLKGIDGAAQIQELMSNSRKNPPKTLGGFDVLAVRDYKEDTRKDTVTGEVTKTGLPESNVLYYELSDNAWCCMRPSGTEPKIKYYFGVKGSSLEDAEKKLAVLKEDLLK